MLGCKRLCADTGYFETYNRPNVHLVDVSEHPIERFTPAGLVTGGREYVLDSMVFATGFDAMTGTLLRWSAVSTSSASVDLVAFGDSFDDMQTNSAFQPILC